MVMPFAESDAIPHLRPDAHGDPGAVGHVGDTVYNSGTGGLRTTARSRATRCFCPLDNPAGCSSMSSISRRQLMDPIIWSAALNSRAFRPCIWFSFTDSGGYSA